MHQRLFHIALLMLVLPAATAHGWGVKQAHQRLADAAIKRAEQAGGLDAFLRDQYGLSNGIATELPLFLALEGFEAVDFEFYAGRFSRIQGGLSDGDPAPLDSFLIQSAASEASPFRFQIDRLIRAGVFAEDNPNPRSRHHFHDPAKTHEPPTANRGLDDRGRIGGRLDELFAELGTFLPGRGGDLSLLGDALRRLMEPFSNAAVSGRGNFDLTGRSARDRALGASSNGGSPPSAETPVNVFALPDAERFLYRAFVGTSKEEREAALAYHFVAFGHVLHLLQDQSSPGHVRNDFDNEHVLGDFTIFGAGLELVGETREARRIIAARAREGSSFASLPRRFLEGLNVELGTTTYPVAGYVETFPGVDATGFEAADFWDTEGRWNSPSPARSGLAERVNPEFLTRGSISNVGADGYPAPSLPVDCNVRLPLRDLAGRAERYPLIGTVIEAPYISSPLVPHLARCGIHAKTVEQLLASLPPLPIPIDYGFTVIDTSVQRDYMEQLFALALDYTEKFISFYFSPRLGVVPAGQGGFRLLNQSALPISLPASEVTLYYDDAGGDRWSLAADCGDSQLDILPGERSIATCTIPTALPGGHEPPASSNDFWVVARGAHGERGSADPGDFETAGFVTFVAHVQPEILFQSAPPLSPGVTDEASQSDLIAIPADLTRSVASANESPTLRNLGLELRPALAQRFNLSAAQLDRLDFISPSAEPGGSRVALALDLAQAQGAVTESPNDIWILDLTKSPQDPGALTMVPKTKPRLATRSPRWVAWNRDGVNDNLVFGAADPVSVTSDLERHDAATGTSLPPRETNDFPGSIHGGVMAAIPGAVGGFDVSDIFLVELGTGIGTHRFELGTLSVEPCGPTGCSVGSSTAPAQEQEPEFSPDGTNVAFISAPVQEVSYTGGKLYVADLIRSGDVISGGSLRRIGTTERATSPIWSPDGEWIVYSDNVEHDLFAVPAAGGDSIRLTYTGTLTAGNLTWLNPLALPTNP